MGSSFKQEWGKMLDASVEIDEAALCSQMLEVLGEVGCAGQHPAPAMSQRGLCRAVLLALFLGAEDDHGARRVPCGIPAWEGCRFRARWRGCGMALSNDGSHHVALCTTSPWGWDWAQLSHLCVQGLQCAVEEC